MKKVTITGCGNCPFFSLTSGTSYGHCKIYEEGGKDRLNKWNYVNIMDGKPVTPAWCPLKEEGITISYGS